MVPEKSSIGLISSKISSRPDCSGTSLRPAALASLMRACHLSLPSSQSNDSVCRARRSGTLSGSVIRAKDTRPGPGFAAEVVVAEALRDAANRGPSELCSWELSPHARQTPRGKYPVARGGNRGRQSAAQTGSVAGGHTTCQVYATMMFTVAPQHRSSAAKRQVQTGRSGQIACVTDATCGGRCKYVTRRGRSLFRVFATPVDVRLRDPRGCAASRPPWMCGFATPVDVRLRDPRGCAASRPPWMRGLADARDPGLGSRR